MFLIDAQHPEAVTSLDRLYREDERWQELKEIYEQYLERAPSADHTMVRLVLSDLSEVVYHDAVSAREMAVSYLLLIFEYDATNFDALNRLSLLHG